MRVLRATVIVMSTVAFLTWGLAGRSRAAQSLNVTVSGNGANAAPVPPLTASTPVAIVAGQTLVVICDGSSDCKNVAAVQSDTTGVTTLTPTTKTAASAEFALQPDLVTSSAANLQVSFNGNKLLTLHLASSAGTTAQPAVPTPVADLLGTACSGKTFSVTTYDAAANVAQVVVTPRGNLLTPLSGSFDENDELHVVVYGDTRLMSLIKVARKSGFRAVGGINILGGNVAVPAQLIRQAAGVNVDNCGTATFVLRDFAPGLGEVEISVVSGSDPVVIGAFAFAVHALYTGMFSLGGLWTPLIDPTFTVSTAGGQSIVVQGEQGNRRFAYTLLYTPFLWEPRDIEKGPRNWYHRFNPSVGFVLNHPLDNVLLGVSADLGASVVLTAGAIFSHVQKLNGLKPGDTFGGVASDLPIVHQWQHDWFIAVSVDLRAAVALVRAVVSAPSTPS